MKSDLLPFSNVRVRLCYAGHEESVVGTLDDFAYQQSGLAMTAGFLLRDWKYESGDKQQSHRGHLFVKWESVFVIEELSEIDSKRNSITHLLKLGREVD